MLFWAIFDRFSSIKFTCILCKTFSILASYKHFGGGATLTCFLPPPESSSWAGTSSINSWKRHEALSHVLLTSLFSTERHQWTRTVQRYYCLHNPPPPPPPRRNPSSWVLSLSSASFLPSGHPSVVPLWRHWLNDLQKACDCFLAWHATDLHFTLFVLWLSHTRRHTTFVCQREVITGPVLWVWGEHCALPPSASFYKLSSVVTPVGKKKSTK